MSINRQGDEMVIRGNVLIRRNRMLRGKGEKTVLCQDLCMFVCMCILFVCVCVAMFMSHGWPLGFAETVLGF